MPEPGKLYIVATPIGNLGDMSDRAKAVLGSVNVIAAEDTRVTGVLLNRFGIVTPMVAYHKFNESGRAEAIVRRMLEGQDCALVTDAGTPGVSDPGAVLAELAVNAGIEVTSVPGPSAVTAALSISGFKSVSYAYLGFLPKGSSAREVLSNAFKNGPEVIVFYESPHRIKETVELLNDVASGSSIVLCNDLTKKFEHVYRGTPPEVLSLLRANPNAEKGEYTVVVKKGQVCGIEPEPENAPPFSIEARLTDICVKNSVTLKKAVALLHCQGGETMSKKEIYAASLNIKKLFEKAP
jgi:16S rRNA (cytidine1402-2'-O)-methyltransferase